MKKRPHFLTNYEAEKRIQRAAGIRATKTPNRVDAVTIPKSRGIQRYGGAHKKNEVAADKGERTSKRMETARRVYCSAVREFFRPLVGVKIRNAVQKRRQIKGWGSP